MRFTELKLAAALGFSVLLSGCAADRIPVVYGAAAPLDPATGKPIILPESARQ